MGRFIKITVFIGRDETMALIINTDQVVSLEPGIGELRLSNGDKHYPLMEDVELVQGILLEDRSMEEEVLKQDGRVPLLSPLPKVELNLVKFERNYSNDYVLHVWHFYRWEEGSSATAHFGAKSVGHAVNIIRELVKGDLEDGITDNAFGLQVYDGVSWTEWLNQDGQDIMEIIETYEEEGESE
jgi:hypothetical protein